MYLRFAGLEIEPSTQHGLGVFQLAYRLLRSDVEYHVRSELQLCLDWFERYLPVPWRLSRPRRTRRAVSWFRPTATCAIAVARRMVATVEIADIPVRMVRTRNPGYVVYSDALQIVAIPFRDTRIGA